MCGFLNINKIDSSFTGESQEGFVSSNTYNSVEINAHNLVVVIRKLREDGGASEFIPWLFQSQTCESFFRLLRSISTTMSTVVNFSVWDALFRIKKLEILNIMQNTLPNIGTFILFECQYFIKCTLIFMYNTCEIFFLIYVEFMYISSRDKIFFET